MEFSWNPDSYWNLDGRSMTARRCVIAQQYSSTTLVSLCFNFREDKLGAFKKTLLLQFFTFLKKKLRKSEIA